VADLWVCAPFQAGSTEAGLLVKWRKTDGGVAMTATRPGN
jgi:hypothetical protein